MLRPLHAFRSCKFCDVSEILPVDIQRQLDEDKVRQLGSIMLDHHFATFSAPCHPTRAV